MKLFLFGSLLTLAWCNRVLGSCTSFAGGLRPGLSASQLGRAGALSIGGRTALEVLRCIPFELLVRFIGMPPSDTDLRMPNGSAIGGYFSTESSSSSDTVIAAEYAVSPRRATDVRRCADLRCLPRETRLKRKVLPQ